MIIGLLGIQTEDMTQAKYVSLVYLSNEEYKKFEQRYSE